MTITLSAGDVRAYDDVRAANRCVHSLFEAQARRSPDAVAARDGNRSVSYRELNAWANTIAHRLIEHGVRAGDQVGLHARRSIECIAAMLAVLKAGAAYVPLEAGLPPGRLRLMAASAPGLILTVPPLRWELTPAPVLDTGGCDWAIARPGEAPGNPDVEVTPDDLLFIPFTSGSSGAPKGVAVPHGSVPGFFVGEDYPRWGPGDSMLYHCALSWDGHLFEIYPALISGGAVCVFPGDSRDPSAVVGFARQQRVSTLLLPPQAFNTVVSINPAVFDWQPRLILGGEAVSADHVAAVLRRTPGLRIINAYGPVEATCLATVREIQPDDLDRETVPIGREVGDRRVYVLDAAGEPVADGEPGEACIGGPAVARGYPGQPALTADRFVPDPFSGVPGARLYRTGDIVRRDSAGVFDFLGRADSQVKLRGFRIELGEVDAGLRSHPSIADAATVLSGSNDQARLVGYVTAAPGQQVDDTELRAFLRQRLTAAMVPAVIVVLDRLPTTENGKLDRRALPEPLPARTRRYVEPVTATERDVARCWRQVLSGAEPSRDDNFFDSGGNSLSATKVALALREVSGADVELRHLYDAPVLAELAKLVEGLGTAARPQLPPIGRRSGQAARAAGTGAAR
jgi:amino acid adenylation domain-containing protein